MNNVCEYCGPICYKGAEHNAYELQQSRRELAALRESHTALIEAMSCILSSTAVLNHMDVDFQTTYCNLLEAAKKVMG